MSSSYKPEVGDIVIPTNFRFEGLRCQVVCVTTDSCGIGVESLEKKDIGHDLDGRLSTPNGYWYEAQHLRLEEKNNSGFKVGDRVMSPSYPERGPGTVKESHCTSLILVEHDNTFESGHSGGGTFIDGRGWFYTKFELKIIHEVKPEPFIFKVGDVIESTDYKNRGPGVIIAINGKVFAVEHFKHIRTHSCRGLGKDGHCWNYLEGQFVLSSASKPVEPVEPEKPEKPEEIKSLRDYSLGDKVKGYHGTGTIVHFTEGGSIGVEHDEYAKGHNCNGHGKHPYCWYYGPMELEKLEPTSLNTVGSESIGMTGTIVGSSGSSISSVLDGSSPLMWNSYADSKPYRGSGIWAEIEYLTESKKSKNSVDKYIQEPIISKKTKKKKSLVIV